MLAPPDPKDVARLRVGQVLAGKWTLDRLIEVGGMGAVYAATHRNGKRVAIKVLHPIVAQSAEIRERFLREGYVANQIDHRGSVSILDDDETPEGAPFLVMELLEGESLDAWMRRAGGRLPLPDVLAICDQVLDVLAAFHAKNIVHRDVKPGNLFVTTSGVVKVLDFGLARLRDPRAGAPTAAGIVLGTASYMAPEQARGQSSEVDARADLFALGAVAFHLLAGSTVHPGESMATRLLSAMKTPVRSIATEVPNLPASVVTLVDRATAFAKADRWASAREMRLAVRAAFDELRELHETQRIPLGASPPVARTSVADEVSSLIDALQEPSVVVEVSFGDLEVETTMVSAGNEPRLGSEPGTDA